VRETSATNDCHSDPSSVIQSNIFSLFMLQVSYEICSIPPWAFFMINNIIPNNGLSPTRLKMTGQWFALPKLFNASKNEGYQIVRKDDEIIQFKNE